MSDSDRAEWDEVIAKRKGYSSASMSAPMVHPLPDDGFTLPCTTRTLGTMTMPKLDDAAADLLCDAIERNLTDKQKRIVEQPAPKRKGYRYSAVWMDHAANLWPTREEIKSTRKTQAEAAFDMYVNAQRSDVPGVMMTMTEKHLASIEWSARLRAKVKASDEETKRKEREQVVCDLQWED
jgi:hypothetical protein